MCNATHYFTAEIRIYGKAGVKMFEKFKETLRRILLVKYSIGFIDGYETGKADGYREGYTDGIKAGRFADGYETGYEKRKRKG